MGYQSTVYLVEDEPLTSQIMRNLFESASLRVYSFRSADEFLAHVTPESRGCLILDLRLPGISGIELLDQLGRRGLEFPTIVVTAYADVATAVQAVKRGAMDVFEKPFSSDALLQCVSRVMQAEESRQEDWSRRQIFRHRLEGLSRREREVLEMVVQGKISKQIAVELGLSHKTVENHRARILDKMRARGSADVIRMYYEATSPPDPTLCVGDDSHAGAGHRRVSDAAMS